MSRSPGGSPGGRNGIPAETVVSFLAPITAQSFEMLASLMDEKRIETLELF
jgi:hypothetical protein